MNRLAIAEPAARNLEEIMDYIALDNPTAAEGGYRGIVAAAQRLPHFPALGRPGRHPKTRELSVSGLPYLIVYAVGAEVVTILAVFHTSRALAQAFRERMNASRQARLRPSNVRLVNGRLILVPDACPQAAMDRTHHDFKDFLRNGGNDEYVIRQRNGLSFGHRPSVKSKFPGDDRLRQAFRQRLEIVAAENARMILPALTPPDTMPFSFEADLLPTSDVIERVLGA